MDCSVAAVFKTPNLFFHRTPSSIHVRKTPFRRYTDHPLVLLKIPPRSPFPPRCCTGSLRRPPRRRNTLRDKRLVISPIELYQVRKPHDSPIPDSHDETINIGSITNLDDKRQVVGKPDLWGKLETWVDKYKEDSEFWGVGTGPIFTIHQDANGNVVRVSVNVGEISKRSRIRAWSLEQKEVAGEYNMDLDSKISRAKLMAKEIETGARMLPRNSSIAKFVAEGRKMPESSVVDGFRVLSLRGEDFAKVLPGRIGFMVLCGCCVLWAATQLFAGSGTAELTREQIEMLRRKKKSRMEREELEKGGIEVIQKAPELPMGSTSRPQLDNNELMKSIMQAKASGETLTISDPLSRVNANDRDFVDKVREIRQMARRARELEQRVQSENGNEEEGGDAASILSSAMCNDVTTNNNAHVEAESLKNESYYDGLSQFHSPVVPDVDIKSKRRIMEDSIRSILDTPDVTINVDDHKTNKKIPTGTGAENTAHSSDPSSPSMEVLGNEKSIGQNEMESNISGKKEFDGLVKRKLKIIRSVKDARDYLAEKHRISTQIRPKQESQFKRLPTADGACGSTYDNKLDYKTNHVINESLEGVRPQVQVAKHVRINYNVPTVQSEEPLSDSRVTHSSFLDDRETTKIAYSSNILLQGCKENTDSLNDSRTLSTANSVDEHTNLLNQARKDRGYSFGNKIASETVDTSTNMSSLSGSVGVTTGEMKPFTEDGVYHPGELNALSSKGHPYQEAPAGKLQDRIDVSDMKSNMSSTNKDWTVIKESAMIQSSESGTTPEPDLKLSALNSSEVGASPHKSAIDDSQYDYDLKDFSKSETSFPQDSDGAGISAEKLSSNTEKTWVDKNFQQFDPIIKKIGVGFKENYMIAKEKVQEQPSVRPEISELGLVEEDGENEWMNDDHLRTIVFQVRENELAGRDPFHLMKAEDQRAFFEGLERKAEKVNEKLLGLHEWVHSRVENLDYGADGISLDDPPEKIIPRWKGPSIDRDPDFLHKFNELQTGNGGNSNAVKEDKRLDKSKELPNINAVPPYSPVNGRRKMSSGGALTSPKTLIECSDGASRPGKKTGKEHWQHTKKWSQGFLDVYNAETDPEIKSIMKDMGKDLDRWITEKEKKDVADLLTRIPKKKRRYIEKKMEKLKREMEMFGAQAVVSKYKEYSDEKEEDYLWWLDLDFVLCIELYTIEDGIPKSGFYSLEMAADLELNPKQYHVIAFEDAGDSKNFCYIVQAHMEMLGSGKAFVVARHPKDAFREAKGNGFSVTVVRRGELKLSVDQTLEEVEEEVAEIGSKIYHDRIMRERSVDIYSLMKGAITADKSSKRRRSNRMLRKPGKS